jgi:putative membrane protein
VLKKLWPVILLLVYREQKANHNSKEIVFMAITILGLLIILVSTWIAYWHFKFHIEEDEKFVVEKGVFKKQKISIPLQNIQAIYFKQNWLYRLLHLSELLIDSPGTEDTEIKITLRAQQAIELKSYIFDLKQQPTKTKNATETGISEEIHSKEKVLLFGLEPWDLIRLGFSENHFRAFFLFLIFIYGILQDVRKTSEFYYMETSNRLSGLFSVNTVKGFLLVIILIVLISIFVSFVRVMIRYANFKIVQQDNGFSVKTGLLEIKEQVIGLNKIQYIKWSANWLRKKMNLYELEFASIGHLKNKEIKITVPITRKEQLQILTAHYGSFLQPANNALKPSSKYLNYATVRFVLIPAIILIALSFFRIYFLWGLMIPAYMAVGFRMFLKKASLCINDELLCISKGKFGIEQYSLQWEKIQSVRMNQNIYQRKHQLATIIFETAIEKISMPFLTLHNARVLMNLALFKIESQRNEG